MPEIKLQHVVSSSSEDKNHPADNILRPEGTHKWKCAVAGEKSASVVIQFEKATEIHSVDIGNEGSAFVEVLVGKSTAASDKDYQVLLVASTFMTPIEARNGTNRNSVRMFDSSKLSAPVLGQKWDRVKIVCTQPFSKTSAFGLSFIKFHGPGSPGGAEKKETGAGEKMGFFKIKTQETDDVKPGNLFSNRGKTETITTPPPLAGAAAMRAASRLADSSKPTTSSTSFDMKSPSSSFREEKSTPKIEKKPSTEKKPPTPSQNREKRKHNLSEDDDTDEDIPKPAMRKQSTSVSSVASKDSGKDVKPPPMKKTKSEPPKDSPVKEFRKLMDKVVFVMSGYQNPYRAELRDRAQAMGATYKPDWGKGCTHLICAFVNTPKYTQVSGKGRIVDKKWINDCYKQKKLLPWRDYRLGDAESPDEDSDTEIVSTKTKTSTSTPKAPKKVEPKPSGSTAVIVDDADDDDDMYGGNTDSGGDTDEEIRRIKEKQNKKQTPVKTPVKTEMKDVKAEVKDDPYDVDTDEYEKPGTSGVAAADSDADSGLPELPDFFSEKHFFIYGNMEATIRRAMIRYITAYAGELEDYMSEKVKYVVTTSKWDNNFDDAIADNPNLAFVKPKWVQVCHDKTKLVPHQPYVVVPPDY